MIATPEEYEVSKQWAVNLQREITELEATQPQFPEELRAARLHAARDVLRALKRDLAAWEKYIAMEDQPPPVHRPENTPVWELVVQDLAAQAVGLTIPPELVWTVLEDMRERDRVGRARYGTPLTAGNGRNHMVDAFQESLDAVAYLRADLDEHGPNSAVSEAYNAGLRFVLQLRSILNQRSL